MCREQIYFNEIDPFAAQWLRNLWPDATVDKRSITDVSADDVRAFGRCHFFGGIGGWEYALQLAGWPVDREVWTGSAPCQPFSSAGKRKGTKDERHLWPEMFRLIRECHPATVIGEQVASAIGHGWLDGIFADMEGEGYACGAIVLGAHSIGAPHIRQRVFWVADAGQQPSWDASTGGGPEENYSASPWCGEEVGEPRRRGGSRGLVQSSIPRLEGHSGHGDDGDQPGRDGAHEAGSVAESGAIGAWSRFDIIPCADGKARRVESGLQCLVDGIPFQLADGRTRQGVSRAGLLKGFGNAIVVQIAAEFIKAYLAENRSHDDE